MQRGIQNWSIIHGNKRHHKNRNQPTVWWLYNVGNAELEPFSHAVTPCTGSNRLSWCASRKTQWKHAAMWWRSQSGAGGHPQMHLQSLPAYCVTVPMCWQQGGGCTGSLCEKQPWATLGCKQTAPPGCSGEPVREQMKSVRTSREKLTILTILSPHPVLCHSWGERIEESEGLKSSLGGEGGRVLF